MADNEPLRRLFALFSFKTDMSGVKAANAATNKVKSSAAAAGSVFARVGSAAARLGQGVAQGMGKVRRAAFQPMAADMKRVENGIGTMIPALAGALAIPKILAFSKSMIDAADEADELSIALGMSVEQIQELQLFAKFGSVEAGALSKGLRTVAKSVAEFRDTGKGKGADVFNELGIEDAVKNSKGLEDSFFIIGSAISKLADDEKKLAASQKLFGTAGVSLITAFSGSDEEIAALRKRIKKIGPLFDSEFAKAAGDFNDELAFTKLAALSLGSALLGKLMPTIRKVGEVVAKTTGAVAYFVKNTRLLEAALAMLVTRWLAGTLVAKLSFLTSGIYGASQGMLILARRSLMAMRALFWIAAVALVFEDLITWIQGGDSALGRFIDSVFGAGESAKALEGLKAWWREFGPSIKEGLGVAIRFVGDLVGALVTLVGMLTTSGDAQKKWGAAFERIFDKLLEKMDGVIKPMGAFFFWLEDSLENMGAKVRNFLAGFNPFGGGNLPTIGEQPASEAENFSRNLGLPTYGKMPVSGKVVETSKSFTLNDNRQNSFAFASALGIKPPEVKAAVTSAQDSDRGKTAKYFDL